MKATKEAYDLFHQGSIALAQVERHGIRIDEDYLDTAIKKVRTEIHDLEDSLHEDTIHNTWNKVYGRRAKLGSREQLAHVFFHELGYKCKRRGTRSKKYPLGRPKADEEAFLSTKTKFAKNYIRYQHLQKMLRTYLLAIKREMVDGYLHAGYNLNTVATYRSSGSEPNLQNIPIRDPELGEMIRRCFIARKGFQFLEIDYKAIEVRISACYNKDPVLIEYIKDSTKDMHRDMAAEIYMVKPSEVSKKSRYCAKNQYVFPQFYGSYYAQCAPALWKSIKEHKLTVGDGPNAVPMAEHLAKKGIRRLGKCNPEFRPMPGTFEHHVKMVEEDFWGRRFKVYAQWKKDYYEAYLERGGFRMKTGFWVGLCAKRNDVLNYGTQGAAFHCLLWSLIQLQKWLVKHKMRSRIIGEIHDSLLLDVHPSELEAVVRQANHIMTVAIRKHWPWIIVPLEIEVEVSPIGKSWFEKTPYTPKRKRS